jgi:hypothetical protein
VEGCEEGMRNSLHHARRLAGGSSAAFNRRTAVC